MAAEFVDYDKNPGYWFMIQLLIAEQVVENPKKYSVKYSDYGLNELDLLEAFDYGLMVHSLFPTKVKLRGNK